jgi:AcrR family transcriptional regulator
MSERDVQPERRTQAERSASTRTALLDATIECLAQDGYANTTTRAIAGRAAVTPGALQHHFAGKSQLVGETTRHLLVRFAQDMVAQGEPSGGSDRERNETLLDRMWELHRGPLFQAALELLVAARTDPDLRGYQLAAQQEIAQWIELAGPLLYPNLAGRPGFMELVMTGQATMRGLAMLSFADEQQADAAWKAAREHLLALSEELMADGTGPP